MRLNPTLLAVGWAVLAGALMHVPARGAPASGCATGGLTTGDQSLSVTSSGLTRSVRLYVPGAAAGRQAVPLVIDLHASGSNGEGQAHLSRLPELGAKEGFIVADPTGGVTLPGAPNQHYWDIPGVPLAGGAQTPADAPDDVQFIADTIDAIANRTCVDPRRIYVTGFSGGARMTSLLACRLSTRIAAIAPVSGLRAGLPSSHDPSQPDPVTCVPQRPVPVVTFHGTGDTENPFNGDSSLRWGYSIPTALKRWAQLDHCQGQPHEQRVSAHVTLVRYGQCQQGADVWMYRTDAPGPQGGGHAWPGSAMPRSLAGNVPAGVLRANPPNTEINASELMWQFFKAHPMPSAASP